MVLFVCACRNVANLLEKSFFLVQQIYSNWTFPLSQILPIDFLWENLIIFPNIEFLVLSAGKLRGGGGCVEAYHLTIKFSLFHKISLALSIYTHIISQLRHVVTMVVTSLSWLICCLYYAICWLCSFCSPELFHGFSATNNFLVGRELLSLRSVCCSGPSDFIQLLLTSLQQEPTNWKVFFLGGGGVN